MVNKISDFRSFVYSSNYSIFCITETWLSDLIYDNEILPTGFNIYRKDRSSRGGGVLIAIDQDIHSSIIFSPSHLEVVAVKVCNLSICTVYVPPNSSKEYHLDMMAYLASLDSNNLLIVGDFNCPDVIWPSLTASTPFSNDLCDFVFNSNLILNWYHVLLMLREIYWI